MPNYWRARINPRIARGEVRVLDHCMAVRRRIHSVLAGIVSLELKLQLKNRTRSAPLSLPNSWRTASCLHIPLCWPGA